MEICTNLPRPALPRPTQRRRNDLIVVASLIDRLPNLAGLCRTCEIFNAGLLTVHNLKVSIEICTRRYCFLISAKTNLNPSALFKIKDDQNFLGISVSSEVYHWH